MRFQGRVTGWKDDQGYGFVIPNGGGEKAFVHIKAFSSRGRRPAEGDLITYEVEKDSKNRLSAVSIRYAGEAARTSSADRGITLGGIFSIGLAIFLGVAVSMGWLPVQVIMLYLAASAVTFIAYALDKSAARNDRWRTKESTLHLFSLAGGWPGALLAQRTLRHKSKKEEFQLVFWVTVVVNCAALGWLVTSEGATFLATIVG